MSCYRDVLETDPNLAPGDYYLGTTLEMCGDHDEAIARMRRAIEIAGPAPIFLGGAGARAGALGPHRRSAQRSRAITGHVEAALRSPYSFLLAHAGLGDTDAALEALQASLDERSAWIIFVPVDARFDPFRDDPRFVSMLAKYDYPRVSGGMRDDPGPLVLSTYS